jgi:hypothetical protein
MIALPTTGPAECSAKSRCIRDKVSGECSDPPKHTGLSRCLRPNGRSAGLPTGSSQQRWKTWLEGR